MEDVRRWSAGTPCRELRSWRLLYYALGRTGFFNLGAGRVQVVGSRDYGKQQREETAQKNEGTRTTKPSRSPGRSHIMPPDHNRGQRQHEPEQIEEQFH